MTKTTTLFNSKTVSSLFGCLVVLCTVVNTHANAAPYDSGIEVKTSQFDSFLDDVSDDIGTDNNDSQLAEKIRQQRAAFNAQSAKTDVAAKTKSAMSSGKNECDQKLRACIKSKCGDDFSKCAGDTDTSWGNKMDLCRMDTTCTGEEYALFTKEIKADRDINARLASYTSIVKCGNEYNNCIITECGKTFTNCLGKTAGDKAVQKCSKIANKCKEQDSGLASRMMETFGNLRGNAEKAIARDEQRLYELRDAMRETCDRLGAMFDERSLDCVYTVNFYAGEDGDLYASRKAYAGSTFNCTQEWFGVDLTTFMENAFRLTRAQSSASSAALGAGVGMAAGAITSGAIGRAVDRAKAERALGEELCTSTGGTWQKAINKCKCKDTQSFNEETGCADDAKKKEKADEKADKEKLKKLCEQNGTWIAGNCKCKDKTHSFDETKGCVDDADKVKKQQDKEDAQEKKSKEKCERDNNGTWTNGTCTCNPGFKLNNNGVCKEQKKPSEADKEAADNKLKTDLNEQKQSVGAKLEADREAKFGQAAMQEQQKNTEANLRNSSLEKMQDTSGETLRNSRPVATLQTTPPGGGKIK